jgi:Lon protease-like protein
MALPSVLPLFPLPNVVLFPGVLLPLHIFEPRYRQMVRDVAAGEELIGMILYRRGGEGPPGGGNDIYPVGCAGRLVRKVDLPDGRFDILLRGVREFRVVEQYFDRPYRRAVVSWRDRVPEVFRLEPPRRRLLVERIRSFLAETTAAGLRILDDPAVGDETLVNLFAFALDLPVEEKQGLLEVEELDERAGRLSEVLEFHLLERKFAFGPGRANSPSRC